MPTPFPHQLSGAAFLAARHGALLADEQRVGKTGAAILACDFVFARTVLVITTTSGRPNWAREFREWGYPRRIHVSYHTSGVLPADSEVVIVGWSSVAQSTLLVQLRARQWDVLILDEAHYAKNSAAQRSRAVYDALVPAARRTWALTGTPIPTPPMTFIPSWRPSLRSACARTVRTAGPT